MLLVFTDLDGTLLDHYSYAWEPACEALTALKQRQHPVVLVSSKTLAEINEYRRELDLPHPVVAENGAVIDVPSGYFDVWVDDTKAAHARPELQRLYLDAKARHGYGCEAFFEMGVSGIARETGLEPMRAAQANDRLASEPILWRDSEHRKQQFARGMREHGLRCVMGGRFLHLMPDTDKGRAVRKLMSAYSTKFSGERITSVSLGDGPNDLDMLNSTDIAVIIPGHHNQPMDLDGTNRVVKAGESGPVGWNEAVLGLIEATHQHAEKNKRRIDLG
ncbi:MAG: HAD-IIB family hydrolase [Pseudomonadota bacterium]